MGGSHISAAGLIAAMDKSRFDPTIVLLGEPGMLTEFFQSVSVPVKRIDIGSRNLANPVSAWKAVSRAARHLADGRYDVVHTNEGKMHAVWGIAAKMAGVKQVWHHRGNPAARGLTLLAPAVAERVVSVSSYAAPRPSFYSAAERCTVIHSPFDLSLCDTDRAASRKAAIASLGVPEDAVLIGYFGHYSDRKRPVGFIDALAAARRRMPEREIHGLMFGEEHDEGMLARMQSAIERHGLGKNVRLMGFRKPIAPWIAACDATLVTAVQEPFGRTLIEAMLLETPVIAAASGGNLEAIEDGVTGLLAPADDPDALADALVRLLSRPDLAESIATHARLDALDKFGIEAHTRAVEAVYDSLSSGASV
ncbi:glycosyltransferase [Qipengyuania zhejiangensis]|uniref:glycosyltransferase n=1 Tax=Qipengyuania zhejiangensis TaxID=3077782 RepID=UPI002D783C85|nr:glycosyltransferase [Qipengyuania sp. Z2]